MKTRFVSQGNEKRRSGILGSMLLRLLIQRLFVPTLILLILSLALAGFFSHRSLEARQIELTRVLANTVETFLQNAENMLRSSAKVADLSEKAQLSFYLKSYREGFGYFDSIYRLDESGVIVQSKGSGIDFRLESKFTQTAGRR